MFIVSSSTVVVVGGVPGNIHVIKVVPPYLPNIHPLYLGVLLFVFDKTEKGIIKEVGPFIGRIVKDVPLTEHVYPIDSNSSISTAFVLNIFPPKIPLPPIPVDFVPAAVGAVEVVSFRLPVNDFGVIVGRSSAEYKTLTETTKSKNIKINFAKLFFTIILYHFVYKYKTNFTYFLLIRPSQIGLILLLVYFLVFFRILLMFLC